MVGVAGRFKRERMQQRLGAENGKALLPRLGWGARTSMFPSLLFVPRERGDPADQNVYGAARPAPASIVHYPTGSGSAQQTPTRQDNQSM